jgi:hypothetical protein
MCWTLSINHLLISFFWYYLDNKCVLPHIFMPSCISKCFVQMVSCMDLESLVYAYFQYDNHFVLLAFFDPIYMSYSIKSKWLRCAWYTNITNKYAHIYMEFVLYIVVSLTTLDPISLGTNIYLNLVLGTLEMQGMLVSFIRKVLSPYNIWSQARMNDKLLYTTS